MNKAPSLQAAGLVAGLFCLAGTSLRAQVAVLPPGPTLKARNVQRLGPLLVLSGQPVLLFAVLLGLLGIILWAAGAQAQQGAKPARAKSSFDGCMERAFTNVEMQDCGSAELKRQEDRLAATWKAAYASLIVGSVTTDEVRQARQALLEEQRAWIRYKDLSCLHWQQGSGREGQVIHFYLCRIGVLRERERQLREELLQPLPRKNER